MDAKVTLSFNADVIEKAKAFAQNHNMSLSRLTEFLYSQLIKNNYKTLYDLPISNWVSMVAEGEPEYITKRKSNKELKSAFHEARKKK